MTAEALERARATVYRARALQARTEAVAAVVAVSRHALLRELDRAEAFRPVGGPFRVSGLVSGHACTVEWHRGVLRGDPEAVERARLVVALHRSRDTAPRPSLRGTQAQALLAVMRGFDRVTSVVLGDGVEAGPRAG